MVIHIGMELAAGISPSRSPPRLACAPVPAVLSARAIPLEILTGETGPSREQNRRRKPQKPPKPPKPPKFRNPGPFANLENGVIAPAQTSETSLSGSHGRMGQNPALYTVRKNYLAWRAGSAVARSRRPGGAKNPGRKSDVDGSSGRCGGACGLCCAARRRAGYPQGAVAGGGGLRGEPPEAALRPHRGGREEQRAAGRGGPDRAQRQAGDVRLLRFPRQGNQGADDDRHDLPHRFDDQADRHRGRHDPGRGGQAQRRRSGVEVHPGLRRHQGRRSKKQCRRHGGDQPGAAGPADDGAGSDAPHLGPDLRRGRQPIR